MAQEAILRLALRGWVAAGHVMVQVHACSLHAVRGIHASLAIGNGCNIAWFVLAELLSHSNLKRNEI